MADPHRCAARRPSRRDSPSHRITRFLVAGRGILAAPMESPQSWEAFFVDHGEALERGAWSSLAGA
ncbi:MAG: hypothetical protein K8H88_04110, partial [Sandaracinaceae bacterium]|nr:hypothetical protein [Sandaracinaceae bacterium]